MRKNTCTRHFISFFMTLSAVLILNLAAFAQTTTFTYQGKLMDTGNPPTGTYQMEFSLYDAVAGGTQIGATIPNNSVAVAQGIFSVRLDFGAEGFTGADRYLQISVRRNAGESFVTLNPRQQITSSPYSIRTLSAAQADLALDSEKLGGIDASEYVNASTVNSTFVRNSTTQQTANFNVSGNGTVGGILQASLVRAQTAPGTYGLTQSDGTTTVSTYTSASGGWFGTRTNSPLNFFTNDGLATMTLSGGNVGIGTISPTQKLDVSGGIRTRFSDSTQVISETTGGTNTWARFYMRTPNRSWAIGTSRSFNADQFYLNDDTAGESRMTIQPNGGAIAFPSGNVGIGTTAPNAKLSLVGGPSWTSAGWTASVNMQNASSLGWDANASGQRFGIGQSNGGLYFFRTSSGQTNNDVQITDTGNITQARDKSGLVKAMLYVSESGSVLRCYNGLTNSTIGACGFVVTRIDTGAYTIDFGFPVNDRFFSLTGASNGAIGTVRTGLNGANGVTIFTYRVDVNALSGDSAFFLLVH